MAIINYTDQFKYTGKGYLDAKMMPVNTFDDLKKISLTQRFEGLTVTVLNNGNPQDYWLVGGVTNSCWIPKDANFEKLKIVLENGFLKLKNDNIQLGNSVNLNDFFNLNDIYIKSVNYVNIDDKNNKGIFMCFTYSNNTKKYLDMSQFLSSTYKPGNGIVINNNVISIDDAIIGKINEIDELKETLSNEITRATNAENELRDLLSEKYDKHENTLNDINNRIANILTQVNTNTNSILKNTNNINTLTERVNALSSAAEGSTPDGKTIGITNDEQKALYVKILEKEGNILKVDSNDGETGLFASIPVFFEDEELN